MIVVESLSSECGDFKVKLTQFGLSEMRRHDTDCGSFVDGPGTLGKQHHASFRGGSLQ